MGVPESPLPGFQNAKVLQKIEVLMRIVVCVKQICHIYARTGMDPGQYFLAPEDRVYRVNPYDEAAVEMAVSIKERVGHGEIYVITLGPMIAEPELRRSLALGADRLFQIEHENGKDPWYKSGLLAQAAKDLGADLVLCGKESLDRQDGQVGAFMAHHLGMPFVSAVTGVTEIKDERLLAVKRSAGRGVREVVECLLPMVLSVDMGHGTGRAPSYMDKQRALSVPLERLDYPPKPGASRTVSARIFPPRPRPREIASPDSRLDAHERIEQLLGGSRIEKRGEILTGSPEAQTEGIIGFLLKHGFLKTKNSKRGNILVF